MKRKIFAITLVLSLLLGMVWSLPTMAAGEKVNLLEGRGYDFEEEFASSFTWVYEEGQGANGSNGYIRIKEGAASTGAVTVLSGVVLNTKPNTIYTLSAWVRTSSLQGGHLGIQSLQNGVAPTGAKYPGLPFGRLAPEGKDRSDWYKVEASFVTAADSNSIEFYVHSWARPNIEGFQDVMLCVDDIEITEGDNLMRNGNFEEANPDAGVADTKGSGIPMPDAVYWDYFYYTSSGYDATGTIAQDPAANKAQGRVFQSPQYGQLFQTVYLTPGVYKFAYKFYAVSGYTNRQPRGGVCQRIIASKLDYKTYEKNWATNNANYYNYAGVSANLGVEAGSCTGKWLDYYTYFNIDTEGYYHIGFGDRWETHDKYYDDATLRPVYDNEIFYLSADTAATYVKPNNSALCSGNLSSFRGNAVKSLETVTATEGVRKVSVIGQYTATQKTTPEDFSLISAIYATNKKTNETVLHDVVIANGKAEKQDNLFTQVAPAHYSANVLTTVDVPVDNDTYTYSVKSFIWRFGTGMEGVCEPNVLS